MNVADFQLRIVFRDVVFIDRSGIAFVGLESNDSTLIQIIPAKPHIAELAFAIIHYAQLEVSVRKPVYVAEVGVEIATTVVAVDHKDMVLLQDSSG